MKKPALNKNLFRLSKACMVFAILAMVFTSHTVECRYHTNQREALIGDDFVFDQKISSKDIKKDSINLEAYKNNDGDKYREEILPLDALDIIGLIILALMLIIATLGGVGGNVVILPICLMFFRFNPHAAIAHTTLFSSISSISRVIIEVSKGWSGYGQKMINYHLVLIVSGPAILGSYIGVTFNKMSPDLWILVSWTLLLLYLLAYSIKNLVSSNRKQKQAAIEAINKKKDKMLRNSLDIISEYPSVKENFIDIAAQTPTNNRLKSYDNCKTIHPISANYSKIFNIDSDSYNSKTIRNAIKTSARIDNNDDFDNLANNLSMEINNFEETGLHDLKTKGNNLRAPLVSWDDGTRDLLRNLLPNKNQFSAKVSDTIMILLLMLLNPLISLLRGSHTMESIIGIEICSPIDFVLVGSYIIILIIICLINRHTVVSRNRNSVPDEKVMWLDGDNWNRIMLLIFGATFLGGFLSAGSSTLVTVWLIAVGINPFIASPTSLLISFVFSVSSAVVYYVNGYIYVSPALIGSGVVLFSTIATRMTIYQYFLAMNKSSVIMIFICIMMVLSILINIWVIAPKIIEDYKNGLDIFAFNSFC